MTKYFRTHPFATGGLLVLPLLVFIILMNRYFPATAPDSFKSFIVAFEFATTPEHIHNLFNNMSAESIRNIDYGNYIDFGFMLTYSVLLAFLFVKAARIFKKKWLYLGIPISIIVFLADFTENIFLLKITGIYVSGLNETVLIAILEKLQVATWTKWGGLAFGFLLFYEVMLRLNWFYKIIGLACLFPFLYILATGLQTPSEITIFTLSVFIIFFVLILFSFTYKKSDDIF
ncbi:MAG: hypothetical protein ABFS16_11015 [Bacteroidota bacterium]